MTASSPLRSKGCGISLVLEFKSAKTARNEKIEKNKAEKAFTGLPLADSVHAQFKHTAPPVTIRHDSGIYLP